MYYRFPRRTLLRCTFCLSALCTIIATQAATEFSVRPDQLQALGVQLQKLDKPAPINGLIFPARVVLPPSQEYVLSAPVAGLVDQLLVSENDKVKAGQPLLRLVSPEFGELQLKLSETASKARLSQKTAQRERSLFADGIVPERRVQEAESTAAEDAARQRQAESALRLAGLDAGTIRRIADGGALQDALVLHARTPGMVTKLEAKLGHRAQAAESLAHIADTRKLWIDVQIPVDQQTRVAIKDAQITGVNRELSATPTGFSATVSDSQTVMLRARVTHGAQLLRVDEFVQVRVPFANKEEAWAVPVSAVVRQDDKAYVFARSAKGFIAVPIVVVDSAGQSIRVKGTLSAGQEIAVTSVIALKAAWLGKGGSE